MGTAIYGNGRKACELISFGKKSLELGRFNPPRNCDIKPEGGLWASTYSPCGYHGEYVSEWQWWCADDLPGRCVGVPAVIFSLREGAKVFEIDSVEDLERLLPGHLTTTEFGRHLDFELLAEEGYDAIHLTSKGQERTRNDGPYELNGWDVESWLILNFDAIAEQRPYEERKAS